MKVIWMVLLGIILSVEALAEPPFDERFQFLYFATLEGAHADVEGIGVVDEPDLGVVRGRLAFARFALTERARHRSLLPRRLVQRAVAREDAGAARPQVGGVRARNPVQDPRDRQRVVGRVAVDDRILGD
mgnify:CR=1 FL=1